MPVQDTSAHPADAHGSRGNRAIPRAVLLLAGLAFAWLALQGLRDLKEIIAPVFLALNLMIAAYPIKTWLSRRKVPHWAGAIITGVTVLLIIVLFFGALGWAIAALVNELPQYYGQFDELERAVMEYAARFGMDEARVAEALKGFNIENLMGVLKTAWTGASSFMSILAVVITVVIFLIMDAVSFDRRLALLERVHGSLATSLRSFAHGVRRYWVVTTVFGLIVAVLDWALLAALGVPLAFVWAVVSFVTNYIPNVGFVLGLVPPALMALLDKGPVAALVVVAGYSVLNFVIQSLIQPKFAGDAVGVTPTVSFLSLMFWASVLGALGALLALPATLLVKAIFVDADPKARWVNSLIATDTSTAETSDAKGGS